MKTPKGFTPRGGPVALSEVLKTSTAHLTSVECVHCGDPFHILEPVACPERDDPGGPCECDVHQHRLKCWPEADAATRSGAKLFEYRKDDGRNYRVGDTLVLEEYRPLPGELTGKYLRVYITHIERGPKWGIPAGYCVMSIFPETLL